MENDIVKAVIEGDAEAIEKMARENPDIISCHNNGKPLIHVAAAMGDLETVRLLVRLGADPSAEDILGKTAIESTKNKEIISYLKSVKRG